MRQLSFIVSAENAGRRLSSFLRGPAGASQRLVRSLKRRQGGICVNGEPVFTSRILSPGDCVVLHLEDEDDFRQEGESLPPAVLYEDEDILAVNKPPDMPVHPSAGHREGTLYHSVLSYLRKKGQKCSFRPVNRLDRDTSGVVLIAKNQLVASRLSALCQKEYLAVAQGVLSGEGRIDLPIRRVEGSSILRQTAPDGEVALTRYRVLSSACGHTLLRVVLETGRTHQIRVHFSALGYPLAGDDLYGGGREWIGRQALHCCRASFVHPVTGQHVTVLAPLPEDMQKLLKELKLDLEGCDEST